MEQRSDFRRWSGLGVVSLAALSLFQFLRTSVHGRSVLLDWVTGWAPNYFGTLSIAFVLHGYLMTLRPVPAWPPARRFRVSVLVATAGLLGWELLQRYLRGFVFDPLDVVATLAGAVTAELVRLAMERPVDGGESRELR